MSDPSMVRSKSDRTSSLLFNKLSMSYFSTSGLISLTFSPPADQILFHLVTIAFLIHGIQSLKCRKMNSGWPTVASLAAISALSIPLTPTGPGTQQNETVSPFSLNSWRSCWTSSAQDGNNYYFAADTVCTIRIGKYHKSCLGSSSYQLYS